MFCDANRDDDSCRCTQDRRGIVPKSHDRMVLDALGVESGVCRMLASNGDAIGCSGYVHGSSRQRD